jgi:thiamine transporter
MKMKSSTQKLVESGVMIGLAVVLSMLKIFQMPLGGSITVCSMLPIMLISYKNGLKWGLGTAFAYSLIQLFLDISVLSRSGLTAASFVGSIFFDYLIAFTLLGLAGIFGKGFVKYILGMVFAVSLRLISHIISGAIFFAAFLPKNWSNPFIYSIAYNATFLLPDLAICLIVGALIYKPMKNLLNSNLTPRTKL